MSRAQRPAQLRMAALAAAVCLLSLAGFWLLYRVDNKYAAAAPQGRNGTLLLSAETLAAEQVIFLTDGWAHYADRLLTPADFAGAASPVPDAYLTLGLLGGFEAFSADRSPHGSASYRLVIALPEERARYTLELPEIFSAYHLYLNGEQAAGLGDPDPQHYRAETANRSITFEAAGRVELLLAVSDFSHLYSGMVYPPAFGRPDAVASLLSTRLLLRALACAGAATVGLLSLLVGLLSRDRLSLLFALLCLLFLGYVGYPIWLTVATGSRLTYALENLCFAALLPVAAVVLRQIGGDEQVRGRLLYRGLLALGLLSCLATAVVHLALPRGLLWSIRAYSGLITLCEWATAAWLTGSALDSLRRTPIRHPAPLCGVLVLDCALVMDRLLPLYEPILGGWFIELACFALVLTIGVAIAQEVAWQYRKNAVLEERTRGAERLLQVQRVHYAELQDQVEQVKQLQHNQRHHFQTLLAMAQTGRYTALMDYLSQVGATLADTGALRLCENDSINLIVGTYRHLAERQGVRLSLKLDADNTLPVGAADLSALLGNLLENALEACTRSSLREPFVDLSISQLSGVLAIQMTNTAADISRQEGGFLSSKASGRRGYGLDTLRAIAADYGGEADFRFDGRRGIFTSVILLTF